MSLPAENAEFCRSRPRGPLREACNVSKPHTWEVKRVSDTSVARSRSYPSWIRGSTLEQTHLLLRDHSPGRQKDPEVEDKSHTQRTREEMGSGCGPGVNSGDDLASCRGFEAHFVHGRVTWFIHTADPRAQKIARFLLFPDSREYSEKSSNNFKDFGRRWKG